MSSTATVTSIQGNLIEVTPLITDACISCTQGCAKRGHTYTCINKKNFVLKAGMIVTVGISKKKESVQGIISLLFPLISAAAGYVLSQPLAKLFHIQSDDAFKAFCVLLFLVAAALVVFFLSRITPPFFTQPEILSARIDS